MHDEIVARLGHRPEGLRVAAVSPDGRQLLTGSQDGTARLWRASNGQPVGEVLTHQARVTAAGFSSDGRALTGSDDGTVRLWDAETGRPLPVTLRHWRQVLAAAFSPDGKRILTSTYLPDGCQLWDARLGKRIGPRHEHTDDVYQVAFSPDGSTAVLAGYDGWAVLWPLPGPVEGDVERIVCWVNTVLGMELDAGGGRQVLDADAWLKYRERLAQLGGPP